eukprot:g226.t1
MFRFTTVKAFDNMPASATDDVLRKRFKRPVDDSHIHVDRRAPHAHCPRLLLVLKCIFILPWRVLGVALAFPVLFACYFLGYVESFFYNYKRPVKETVIIGSIGWRLFHFLHAIVVILEFDDEEENYFSLRDTPFLVANHVGYVDGAILPASLYRPKPVFVSWVLDVPVMGRMARDLGGIPVDLSSRASREASLAHIAHHADSWRRPPRLVAGSPGVGSKNKPLPHDRNDPRTHGGQTCLIFPEGGCRNGERLGEFKKGAFTCGREVRPILVSWSCPSGWNIAFTDAYVDKKDLREHPNELKFCDPHDILEECRKEEAAVHELVTSSTTTEGITTGDTATCSQSTADTAPPGQPVQREQRALGSSRDEPGSSATDASRSTTASSAPGADLDPRIKQKTVYSIWNRACAGKIALNVYVFAQWLFCYCLEPYHVVTLRCMRKYKPSEEEVANPDLYAANVRRLLQVEYQKIRLHRKAVWG